MALALATSPALAFPVEDAATEQGVILIHNDSTQIIQKIEKTNSTLSEVRDGIGTAGPVSTPSAYTVNSLSRAGLTGLVDGSSDTTTWGLTDLDATAKKFTTIGDGYTFFGGTLTSGFQPPAVLKLLGQAPTRPQSMSTADAATILRRRDDQLQRAALIGMATAANSNANLDAAMQQADLLVQRARGVQNTQERLTTVADGLAAILNELVQARAVNTQLLQLQSATALKMTNVTFGVTAPGQSSSSLPR